MIANLRKKSNLLDRTFSFVFEHKKFGEKIRYLFIGGICALADLAILYFLVDILRIWYLTASIVSFIAISFFGYYGQKYFTFKNKSANHKKQLLLFYLMAMASLAINSLSMLFFVSFLGLWYILGSALTKLIVLTWNFIATKYVTFK